MVSEFSAFFYDNSREKELKLERNSSLTVKEFYFFIASQIFCVPYFGPKINMILFWKNKRKRKFCTTVTNLICLSRTLCLAKCKNTFDSFCWIIPVLNKRSSSCPKRIVAFGTTQKFCQLDENLNLPRNLASITCNHFQCLEVQHIALPPEIIWVQDCAKKKKTQTFLTK